MITLVDIKDYVASLEIADADHCYCGKLADKKDKSIGVYQLRSRQPNRIPLGGIQNATYGTKGISILVHWNESPRESEIAANALQEALISCRDEQIKGQTIKFIDVAYNEPVSVDTDDNGIYEYVIECLFIMRKVGKNMPETAKTGVYPCYENQFSIGEDKESATGIADAESFSVSFDNGIEEWTPFDTEGWVRRLPTAKGVTITVTAKRNIGDEGNDFVAGKTFKNGRDTEAYFAWNFPDGTVISWDAAIINVTNMGSGDSTNVAPLEFDVMSNGKPTITPPIPSA